MNTCLHARGAASGLPPPESGCQTRATTVAFNGIVSLADSTSGVPHPAEIDRAIALSNSISSGIGAFQLAQTNDQTTRPSPHRGTAGTLNTLEQRQELAA